MRLNPVLIETLIPEGLPSAHLETVRALLQGSLAGGPLTASSTASSPEAIPGFSPGIATLGCLYALTWVAARQAGEDVNSHFSPIGGAP